MKTPHFLDPNNSFIQHALERQFGVPPKESADSEVGGKATEVLKGKQKWKMLSHLPGKNQSNTWSAMNLLNQGFKHAEGGQKPYKPSWKKRIVQGIDAITPDSWMENLTGNKHLTPVLESAWDNRKEIAKAPGKITTVSTQVF